VITLEQLNALTPGQFVATLGVVFEHSPWVAERAAAQRPFASRLQLLDTMRAVVDDATPAEQLALIRAHPKLGTRGRSASPLTVASAGEQRRAGLAACTPADGVRLEQLNALYLERFGFPYILAVRGHDPASIIANLERRLRSDIESERQAALSQIGAIAAYRLADLVASPPGPEIVAMLERLLRSSTASGMVREWMQAAGLEVWPAPGSDSSESDLVGRARGGESTAKTLLAGVCRDEQMSALRYQGRAAFIIAIEVAQQLQHQGARPAFALAVLARPDDAGRGDTGGLPDGHAPQIWVELGPAAAADAEGSEILRTLRMAQLGTAVTLVRQGCAFGGQGAATFDAAAAGRAALALEQSLRRVQTAAHG
jgi:allantoate deiminase/N-carbamoyl-L-amino-acid hydrolase